MSPDWKGNSTMQDKPRHWCLCGAPYELLSVVSTRAMITKHYWYCFSCGAYEGAEGVLQPEEGKSDQLKRNNGKKYYKGEGL